MFRKTKVCSGLMLAFGGGLALGAFPAMAQQQLERVEITGSAIKRIDAETAVPVTVLKMDDMKREGITSIEQVLQRLAVSTSLTSTSQVVGAGTGGASFADLRGIGPDKTLVLLNGRRIANNALQSNIPDLNMIPFGALDRVEVLRDGASALYGTDAIGGVINFITRKDYSGGELSLNATLPKESGGKSAGVNGSIGFGSLDKSGWNALAVLDYQKTDRINSQERGFGSRSYIPERGVDGTSGTTFPANYSQQGAQIGTNPETGDPIFATNNANPTFPACAPVGNGGSINTGASATNCRFDPAPFQDLTPKSERVSAFGKVSVKLPFNAVVGAEYFLTRNVVETQIGPVPQVGLTMRPTSPFFPGNGITPAPTNFVINPALNIGVNWRAVAAGPRQSKAENTSQRLVLSLEGQAAGWEYNVAGTYNENELIETLTGGYSNDAMIFAGVRDGIINPFGPQTPTGTAYLASAALRGELQTAKGKVGTVDLRGSRELGDWFGAGTPAAIALGAEFRKEKFFDDVNGPVASQAGSTGLDPAADVTGERNVSAFYGELNVPLLKSLEATLAVRHDRYSDFGSSTNPKVGVRFQPIPQLLTRASYSTGFRAPSLYELYAPNSITFSAGSYNDPVLCPGGVPTPVADPGRDCNQQFRTQNGGNANLEPEKAKNFTLGFVIEPTKDLSFGIDYWWIRLKNSIAPYPEAAVFADTVANASRFVRNADGSLNYFVATNDNLGETHTRGVDVSANYRMLLPSDANITIGLNGVYVTRFEYQREIGGEYIQNVGRFSDAGVIFRWKHALTAAYNARNWSLGVTNNYARDYTDENFVDDEFVNRVGTHSTFDLFGSYTPVKALTISAGIKNLLDQDPPFSNQGQTFQVGYDPRYTDPTGRAFYARLTYTFK